MNDSEWFEILADTVHELEQFPEYFDQIEDYFEQILKTGQLPKSFSMDPNTYAQHIYSTTIKPLIQNESLSKENFQIVIKYFQILLHYSMIYNKYHYRTFLKFPYKILSKKTPIASAYNENYFDALYSFIAKDEMLTSFINSLKTIKSINNAYIFSLIIFPSLKYDNDKVTSKTCPTISNFILQEIDNEFRNTQIDIVFEIFTMIFERDISQNIVNTFLKIVNKCLKCEQFDKQLNCLKWIAGALSDENYSFLLEWISNKFDIFLKLPIHSEFSLLLAEIIGSLLGKELINFNAFKQFWDLNLSQENDILFSILIKISYNIPKKLLNDFSKMVLHGFTISVPYIQFLGNIVKIFEKRYRKENKSVYKSFVKAIAQKIHKIEKEFPRYSKDYNEYRKISSEIKAITISQSEVDELVNSCIKKPISQVDISLIWNVLNHHDISDKAKSKGLINYLLSSYNKTNSQNQKYINEIVFKLINFLKIKQNNDLFQNILLLYKNDSIYDLIEQLINSKYITDDYFISFFMKLETNTKNFPNNFINVVEGIFKNEINIKTLPFKNEGFLWKFSSNEYNVSEHISSLLVNIYTSNNSLDLNDSDMINTFYNTWCQNFKKYNTPDSLLSLIYKFLLSIESNFYIRINSHFTVLRTTIDITVDNKEYSVNPNMTIYALLQMIKGKLFLNFSISYKSKILQGSDTIQSCIIKSNKVHLKVISRKMEPIKIRTVMPSNVLLSSEAYTIIFEQLKKGNSKAKLILDYLPTDINIIHSLQIINTNDFNTQDFFPKNNLYLFLYNLETLIENFNKFNFSDEFIGFLIENGLSSPNPQLISTVIYFLNKIKNVSDSLNRTIFISILESISKFLDKKENINQILNKILDFGYNHFKSHEYNEDFPVKYKEIICLLLNHKDQQIRSNADFFLYQFNIPCNFYIDYVKNMQDPINNISSEFFSSMGDHLDKSKDNNIIKSLLLQIIDQGIEREGHLYCISKFVEKKYLNEKEIEALSKTIAENYFNPNGITREQKQFDQASKLMILFSKVKQTACSLFKILHIQQDSWRINGDKFCLKSDPPYVGLENLGATCFLNSVTQLMHSIKSFRSLILSYQGQDPFTSEFQDLFARLSFSNFSHTSPEKFVNQIEWYGEKLDPSKQQDGCEYLDLLLDKLENQFPPNSISNLFKGTYSLIIETLADKKIISKSPQSFMVLPLEIFKSNTLQESFNLFSQPEYLKGENGYQIDNKKVDVKVHSEISELPNNLIIQLKRFQYNYSNWARYKLTKEFEFPLEFQANDKVYKIKGIVIHQGTAEKGHYFSFLKIKKEWIHFNDSVVSKISESDVIRISKYDGYLLYYKAKSNEIQNWPINRKIQQKIDEMNNDINQKRLFCSKEFYKIMKGWASSKNSTKYHIEVVIKYMFKILPFCYLAYKAPKLYSNLENARSKEPFSLIPKLITFNPLIGCPIPEMRLSIKKLIKLGIPKKKKEHFYDTIMKLLDDSMTCPSNFDEYFALLYHLKKIHYQKDENMQKRLESYFRTFIGKYWSESKLSKNKSLAKMNLHHLLLLLSQFNLSASFLNFLDKSNVFAFLLSTGTNINNITFFVSELQNIKDFQLNHILEQQKNHFPNLSKKFYQLISSLNNQSLSSSSSYESYN